MKYSELRRQGRQLLQDVFSAVLSSGDKEDWMQAIRFMNQRIAKLEREIDRQCAEEENADHHVRNLWHWQEARRQLSVQFGRKFISISLSPQLP